MMPDFARSIRWRITGAGVRGICPGGLGMPAFEYKQAEEIKEALKRHRVRYLFLGKSSAILLGFPDTTQDADLFVDRGLDNGRALVEALRELDFDLTSGRSRRHGAGQGFHSTEERSFRSRSRLRARRHRTI